MKRAMSASAMSAVLHLVERDVDLCMLVGDEGQERGATVLKRGIAEAFGRSRAARQATDGRPDRDAEEHSKVWLTAHWDPPGDVDTAGAP